MPRGGKRNGAGRPKGSKDRRTLVKEQLRDGAAQRAAELTPLEYMIGVMQDEDEEPELRMEAAKAAAPYMHSKRPQKLEHSGEMTHTHAGAVRLVPAMELPDNGRNLPPQYQEPLPLPAPPSESSPT